LILIVGGAGYIGAHVNKLLNQKGFKTVVFDNLVYGHREFARWGDFVLGDLPIRNRLILASGNTRLKRSCILELLLMFMSPWSTLRNTT